MAVSYQHSSRRHEDLVFHQDSVPLLSCHSCNVQWTIFLVMVNGDEESMVPEQYLMEQIKVGS